MTLRNIAAIGAAPLACGGPALGQSRGSSLPACGRAECDQYLQKATDLTTARNRTLQAAVILTKGAP
jgi:hypothetical protein